MGGLRKNKSSALPTPKPIRLPLLDDSNIQETRAKTTRAALARQGQGSTFLSSLVRSVTGSGGFLGR